MRGAARSLKCNQPGCAQDAPAACVGQFCPAHCKSGADGQRCQGHVRRIRSKGGGSDRGTQGAGVRDRHRRAFVDLRAEVRACLASEKDADGVRVALQQEHCTQDEAVAEVLREVKRQLRGDDSETQTHSIVARLFAPWRFQRLLVACSALHPTDEHPAAEEKDADADEQADGGEARGLPRPSPLENHDRATEAKFARTTQGAAAACLPDPATQADVRPHEGAPGHIVCYPPAPGKVGVFMGDKFAPHWCRDGPPFWDAGARAGKRGCPRAFDAGGAGSFEQACDYIARRLRDDRPELQRRCAAGVRLPYAWDFNSDTQQVEPGHASVLHRLGLWYRYACDPWVPPGPPGVDAHSRCYADGRRWECSVMIHCGAIHNWQQTLCQGLRAGPNTKQGKTGVYGFALGGRHGPQPRIQDVHGDRPERDLRRARLRGRVPGPRRLLSGRGPNSGPGG